MHLLDRYRCEAYKEWIRFTAYKAAHVARGTDIARFVAVKALESYW